MEMEYDEANLEDAGGGGAVEGSTGGTYTAVGYVAPVTPEVGIGGAVVVTDKGDTLVSVVVSNPGKISTVGTIPAGQNAVDWLSGLGGSITAPSGAGYATNFDTMGPTKSPAGSVGAGLSLTAPLIPNPTSVSDQIHNVINGAINYANKAMGIQP